MRIARDGKIGIGIQTPEDRLHLFNESAGTVKGNANAP